MNCCHMIACVLPASASSPSVSHLGGNSDSRVISGVFCDDEYPALALGGMTWVWSIALGIVASG